ncbi:MAG: homing endonuclease associated repeat-containing protein, partial [Chloroflexota bacterium]
DIPTHQVYVKRFGSWRTALEAAGMAVSPRNAGYDRATLVNHVRALAEDLGRSPTCVDLKAVDGPCYDTYRHHFGGWAVALEKAGLEVKPHSRRYNEEELLDILRDLAEELGHAPSMAELWEREDLPTPSAYKYRFGRWNDALREAGLAPRYEVSDQEGAD